MLGLGSRNVLRQLCAHHGMTAVSLSERETVRRLVFKNAMTNVEKAKLVADVERMKSEQPSRHRLSGELRSVR